MPQSESIGKLAEALAKAQAIMKPALKDAENPFFKSRYADLASVWDAIREPLTKHGLSVVQMPQVRENTPADHVYLETRLLHASGEWLSSVIEMKPTKNDPQAIGSCFTYARRYALAAITGVAAEEDDDGQAASAPAPQRAVQSLPVRESTVSTPSSEGFTWRLGKFKGTPLEDVETGYLDWFSKNGNVQDHRAAAIMELDRRNGQEIFEEAPEPEFVAASLETAVPGGAHGGPPTMHDLTFDVQTCETIKEWAEVENVALALYEQGATTAAEWATYRGASDLKKKSLAPKKK